MNCPKCRHEQEDANLECEKCGIIFAKYFARLNAQRIKRESYPEHVKGKKSSFSWRDLLLYVKPDEGVIVFYGRLLVFVGIIFWGCTFVLAPIQSNYAGESCLHLVNLPFHEAGHIFFRPFGPFITSLGGTLGQLIMPLVCLVVLLVQTRDTFGASVTLWWFGQNFFDIAPYVNDARSLQLPLVGGNYGHSSPYGFHDWEYLLTESGLLQYDHLIAKMLTTTGTIIFILSFIWGGLVLYRQFSTHRK